MAELTCLELAVGLWFVHLFCQMGLAGRAFSTAYLFSSRDAQLEPKGPYWGRATRAFANYVENFVVFAALDLALIVTHGEAGFAPTVWIVARVLYLPLYLFNVMYARTGKHHGVLIGDDPKRQLVEVVRVVTIIKFVFGHNSPTTLWRVRFLCRSRLNRSSGEDL